MDNTSCNITLLPHGRQIVTNTGENVLEALLAHNIFLRSDCGGKGKCGKCRVEIIAGDGSATSLEACTLKISGNISLRIPELSLLSPHIIDKAPAILPASFLSKPVKNSSAGRLPGIAVDLGTTTLAVYLCDTANRKVLSSVAVKNPQALYGDDVMSRIGQIGEDPGKLVRLQQLVIKAIEWGIGVLLEDAALAAESLKEMVVVGNPTMIHILLGVSPFSIGLSPYTPQFFEARQTPAADLGLAFPHVTVHTLPQVSGFIGGDMLAAILATELAGQPTGTLLVDLGTNGELVLKGGDGLYATSCATGPAFEGAALSCGMQAIPGAIDKVVIDVRENIPKYSVVRKNDTVEIRPSGLCGSGVISAVSALIQSGLVDSSGLFDRSAAALRQSADEGRRYVIVAADQAAYGREIAISQKDIRAVQLGKAALITGIEFLLRAAGVEKVQKIMIAGAFGSYLDKEDMAALGMIPAIDPKSIEVYGNSAGAGAIMALCDEEYRLLAEEYAADLRVIELAAKRDFQNAFIQRLGFPQK
jgi:uncharacterized 2Fe-2S/4Fe-4S cluster protein (DUF4445 family)